MPRRPIPVPPPVETTWTFLSNHGHVLLCIASDPEVRLREVALRVGITERAVQRIVADLEEGGYLTRIRVGRRNKYDVHGDRHLRHPVESHQSVQKLLDLLPEHNATGKGKDGERAAGRG